MVKFPDERRTEGILQTDGYTAYDQIGGTSMVHAACWAHYLESMIIQSNS
ncbi:MAG: IS66 family transposase [Acidobacteriia bacterium]|nr:IS66 family transposase [Terriglobia bacterium]